MKVKWYWFGKVLEWVEDVEEEVDVRLLRVFVVNREV